MEEEEKFVTTYRKSPGWSRREPGKRPDLTGTWLDPANEPAKDYKSVRYISYSYHIKIHWATPPWITDEHQEQMKQIYNKAYAGLEAVDHIVPLKHPLVCGLHVPWNLRVIPYMENARKSNNWWPDCPDHLCPVKNLPKDMFVDLPDFGPPHYQHQMALL
jgi:hypothetical protein